MKPQYRSNASNPYANRNLLWLVESKIPRFGDKDFLIWEPFWGAPQKWTYSKFMYDVKCLALGLQKRGIKVGDAVLIHLENCPEALLAWHAIGAIGAIAVTTNTKSTASEMEYFIENSGPIAAITQPKFANMIKELCASLKFVAVTEFDGDALEPQVAINFDESFSRLYDAAIENLVLPNVDPWRPLSVQYTSGTTSKPKGVLWTHANALWGGEISARHEELTQNDVHYVHLPMFHTNAQVYSSLATLWVGATMVLSPRFTASRFWEISIRNKCTFSSMIPFCVRALAEQPKPEAHFYRIWAPAVSMPDVEKYFGVRTMGWWGMTETITHGILTYAYEDSPFMSIGRCATEYEIAILNEDGSPCKEGDTGSLLIKGIPGISLFDSYLNNLKATEETYDEMGYMRTGDRVRIGENGHLYFADREKDMLKIGGENVAASEIEAVIARVNGVGEVAVVGKPDKMLDEVAVAFLTIKPGSDGEKIIAEINKACEVNLAQFKRVTEVYIVDELPRSTLEKIAKAELKKRFE